MNPLLHRGKLIIVTMAAPAAVLLDRARAARRAAAS